MLSGNESPTTRWKQRPRWSLLDGRLVFGCTRPPGSIAMASDHLSYSLWAPPGALRRDGPPSVTTDTDRIVADWKEHRTGSQCPFHVLHTTTRSTHVHARSVRTKVCSAVFPREIEA